MDSITAYFELVKKRPELFAQSERVPLVLDEDRLRRYSAATGRQVGLVYDNSPYYSLLADLCGTEGHEFVYCRVVYPHPESNGVVIIPRCGDQLALLSVFRHGPRAESDGEFPRGFAEGLTPLETAQKELREELGVRVTPERLTFLGQVRADSGLSSGQIQVFLAEVEEVRCTDTEGIHGLRWVTADQLRRQIADGRITDGLTLSAYALLSCRTD